jgi:hypothetical protein
MGSILRKANKEIDFQTIFSKRHYQGYKKEEEDVSH